MFARLLVAACVLCHVHLADGLVAFGKRPKHLGLQPDGELGQKLPSSVQIPRFAS